MSSNEELLAKLDQQHLLFTGSGYTVLGIYAEKKGTPTVVKYPIWTNDGSAGEAAWSGLYRFCLEGRDTNPDGKECIAELPADVWARIKSETFYVTVSGASPQIRVVTGWWNNQWPDIDKDIQPGNELLTDNGDGTWTLAVNLAGSALADAIDVEHLLFTGGGFAVEEIYFEDIRWDPVPMEIDIAPFTYYEDRSATLTYPYYPSWGDNSGKLRIMRPHDELQVHRVQGSGHDRPDPVQQPELGRLERRLQRLGRQRREDRGGCHRGYAQVHQRRSCGRLERHGHHPAG